MKSNTGFYKWELLIWLWLAFFFNQADRQIFNILLPLIKIDLQLTDVQLGLISSLFILVIGIFIPIAGVVGDMFSKKRIIWISVLFWSIATLLTGASTGLIHLILFRSIAVGGGEAFYAPSANALIGEYHKKTRALAMSVHQTSLYAGVILSGTLGGLIAQWYGWKFAFYIFGGTGIVLAALLAWRIKSIQLINTVSTNHVRAGFIKEAVLALFKKPTAILLGMAFACLVFVNVAYLTWMPTFLHEKFKLSIVEAGFSSMFYHHIFAFAGVIFGGWCSDKFALKSSGNRLIIQSVGLLLGAPFILAMGQAENASYTYVMLAAFGFCRGIYEANTYTTLFLVIEPQYRSTSVGIISMFAFITGAIAPVLLGYLKPGMGLSNGLSSLSVAYLIGGVLILVALIKFYKRDVVSTNPQEL
ncbi:Sugar phosphate permease [Pedobacter sp. ok626]|uniref:MFS transporter n=1 Tax=Pedobacter sp. ok626 TaxID=1761882 RepID=UPI00088421BC|nr:MFS transporter [Pedobacter sp. ok626]SDJ01048.1 Sugar phosphate permease [Pedobacter sp. ok626]